MVCPRFEGLYGRKDSHKLQYRWVQPKLVSVYRYRRTDGRSPASAPCEGEDSPDSPSEESSRLQQFFERLGLDPRDYDAIVLEQPPESPVYFSSASTVDSNQLAATADYTVTVIYHQGHSNKNENGERPRFQHYNEPPRVFGGTAEGNYETGVRMSNRKSESWGCGFESR